MPMMFLLGRAALAGCAPCDGLDAVDKACEAAYGDGDALCEAIGDADEGCGDRGEAAEAVLSCATLCADVQALDDRCDVELGPADVVCQGLDPLAEACEASSGDEDEDDDARDADEAGASAGRALGSGWSTASVGCAVGSVSAAGGAFLVPLAVVTARRARRGGQR